VCAECRFATEGQASLPRLVAVAPAHHGCAACVLTHCRAVQACMREACLQSRAQPAEARRPRLRSAVAGAPMQGRLWAACKTRKAAATLTPVLAATAALTPALTAALMAASTAMAAGASMTAMTWGRVVTSKRAGCLKLSWEMLVLLAGMRCLHSGQVTPSSSCMDYYVAACFQCKARLQGLSLAPP